MVAIPHSTLAGGPCLSPRIWLGRSRTLHDPSHQRWLEMSLCLWRSKLSGRGGARTPIRAALPFFQFSFRRTVQTLAAEIVLSPLQTTSCSGWYSHDQLSPAEQFRTMSWHRNSVQTFCSPAATRHENLRSDSGSTTAPSSQSPAKCD